MEKNATVNRKWISTRWLKDAARSGAGRALGVAAPYGRYGETVLISRLNEREFVLPRSLLNPSLIIPPLKTLRNSRQGFSLVEVVFALFIFGIALLGSIALVAHTQLLRESASGRSTAAVHAQRTLEAVRLEADTSLPTAQAVNWSQWAQNNGLNTLSQETVSVSFNNVATDLEQVTVDVSWQTRQHPMNYQVITRMTDR